MRKKIIGGLVGVLIVVGVYIILTPQTKNMAVVDTLPEDSLLTIEEEVLATDTPSSTDPLADTGSTSAELAEESIKEEDKKENQVTNDISKIANKPVLEKTALLANGCFWCVESDLEKVSGVLQVVSGYAGGQSEDPTYKNYAAGGHREVVLVTYDAHIISYANLVEFTIKHGDPTDSDGSFKDRGVEYAPAIYFETAAEEREARRVIAAIDSLQVFAEPLPLLVTERVPFWPAEDYHQDYAVKNPLRYGYYRTASGRSAFIEKYWGESADTFVVPAASAAVIKSIDSETVASGVVSKQGTWDKYLKPTDEYLRSTLSAVQYKVTQEEGTETPFTSSYDKNFEAGVYVDIVSGEPLFLSKDKYDSGTGWPSFVKPLSADVVTLEEDNTLFTKRTEVRSRYADSHLGHVFTDGPKERGGMRYCMNGAALRFIAESDLEASGYGYLLPLI
jgi:peptide methionine sulfoxide reductase msrA/msrB